MAAAPLIFQFAVAAMSQLPLTAPLQALTVVLEMTFKAMVLPLVITVAVVNGGNAPSTNPPPPLRLSKAMSGYIWPETKMPLAMLTVTALFTTRLVA